MATRERQAEAERSEASAVPDREADLEEALAAADSARRKLDVARGREAHLVGQIERLEERLVATEEDVAALGREVQRRDALVADIQRTLSWRVTAPLRAIRRAFPRS
jgi:predicted  nucleic acid-binding Zn-ribbon protein